jgi:acyl-CoA thioester hydrolase
MEQARIEWITSLGFSCTAEKEAMIMVNGFCNFYKQVSFPASLRISTFVGQIGNSTVDLINTMDLIGPSADQEPVLCAAGGATMLWVDLEKNKSMPWPESILKVLR